jgi:DNA invertase Pin-like site-specific DNA recombinase
MVKQRSSFVAYYRVSTARQGESGLGLDAQRAAVEAHVERCGGVLLDAFTEIESGRKAHRLQLERALAVCRERGAVLAIAKLDRLARNVAFLSKLMDGDVEFVALDQPGANRLTLHVLAAVAEAEADAISQRTKAALAAAKARGVKLGGDPANLTDEARRRSAVSRRADVESRYRMVMPLAVAWRREGRSLQAIATEFNQLRAALQNGGTSWTPIQVSRVLGYAARAAAAKEQGVALG